MSADKSPLFIHVRLDRLDEEFATYSNPHGGMAVIPRSAFESQGCPITVRVLVEYGEVQQ